MTRLRFAALLLPLVLWSGSGIAQQPPAPPANADQTVLTRGLLEALRANTDAQTKVSAGIEMLTNRLERVEAATRNLPPTLEGLRTDLVAIRAAVEKLSGPNGIRRPAATLKFGPFACGNETEASCATNACRSVGYRGGITVTAQRSGTPPNTQTTGIGEATCYD